MIRAALALGCAACGRIDFDPVPTDLARDCALWLKMDEDAWTGASNEIVDSCGEPNNGTETGGAQRVDDPVRGRVGSFPVGSCIGIVDAPELDAVDAVTMSAWVFVTAFDGNAHGLISKRVAMQTDPSYSIYYDGGHLTIDIGDDGDSARVPSTVTFATGRWVQITAVFDGHLPKSGRTRLYFDGRPAETLPELDTVIAPKALAPLHVGCLPEISGGGIEATAGLLDDAAVWTRALDAIEVEAWYEQTVR